MRKQVGLYQALAGLLLLLNGLFPDWVRANELSGIEVETNQADVQFPREIAFQLEITTTSPIETITLEYGVQKASCGHVVGHIEPEITERLQRRHVTAVWTWELYRSGSLPPGTRVWWRWQITTEAGESRTTPRSWITFADDDHDWQTLSGGEITVYWYEGGQAFGQRMLQTAVEAQARLTADPDANLEESVQLYFYANSDDLQAALIFPQRWTGGIAFTDYYTVLIGADPQDPVYGRRTVAHELMHLVVHQLTFNCWSTLPRWLDEGLASWAEGDLEPVQQEALDEAIAGDKLLSLRSLSGSFSAHADRAHLSYAHSYSVVVFLMETYGREKILELLSAFRDGATYDGALEQVYDFDTDDLDAQWRASVGAQPRPTATAPFGSPTPVPTFVLWDEAPTLQPATMAPTLATRPAMTSTPPPTELAVAASPRERASATPGSGHLPIGGPVVETSAGGWAGYAIAGAGVLVASFILAFVYLRRR